MAGGTVSSFSTCDLRSGGKKAFILFIFSSGLARCGQENQTVLTSASQVVSRRALAARSVACC